MQQLWDQILHLLSLLIIPDWGGLILLIPLGVAAVVVVYLVWLALRYATAGPTRVAHRRRLPAQPPAEIHMPGGSLSPLLISVAAAILLLGLVFRGVLLPLGLVALVMAVLNWGREAMRDYERVAGTGPGSTALITSAAPAGPPPGIHLPAPSFRPLLLSIAAAVALLGLVFGPPITVAGALMLLAVVVGWLRDSGREYRAVVTADRTGHLLAQPAPGLPVGMLSLFGVLLVVAIVINVGLPLGSTSQGGGGASPGASAPSAGSGPPAASGPAASGGASPGPGSSAGGGPQPGGAAVAISAKGVAFEQKSVSAPANTVFSIAFTNSDQGVPHNVAIHKDSPTGQEVFKGTVVTGPTTTTYSVPALAPGTYPFVCSVHSNMTGTLTVQ